MIDLFVVQLYTYVDVWMAKGDSILIAFGEDEMSLLMIIFVILVYYVRLRTSHFIAQLDCMTFMQTILATCVYNAPIYIYVLFLEIKSSEYMLVFTIRTLSFLR